MIGAKTAANAYKMSDVALDAATTAAKSTYKYTGKAASSLSGAATASFEFAAKNPKLTAAGLTITGVGTYATINGLTMGEATAELTKKTAEQLAPIAKELVDISGDILEAGTDAVSNSINLMISKNYFRILN